MAELKKRHSALTCECVARLKESDQRGLGIRHQRADGQLVQVGTARQFA